MSSKMLSTSAVARMLGVAVASVSNWIDQGQLKAGRTPGGHRRVKAEDLVDFLKRQTPTATSTLNVSKSVSGLEVNCGERSTVTT